MLTTLASIALMLSQTGNLPITPVSCHLQAMTVGQALKLISKKAGVSLNADESLSHDIVLIRTQETPLKDLGKQLGHLLDADWTVSNGGFQLSRSAESAKAEEEQQLKVDAEDFGRTQAKLKQVDQSYGSWNEEAAKALTKLMLSTQADPKVTPEALHRLELQTPLLRLFSRLMSSIPPEDLAQIPHWGRTVYTIRPNHAQKPMPSDGIDAIVAFAPEQVIWANAGEPFANLNLSEGLASARPFRSTPAKVYLALRRDEGANLQAEMRLVDSAGNNLAVAQADMSPTMEPTSLPVLPDSEASIIPFPATTVLAHALKAKQDLRESGHEDVLRPLLATPELQDPLATLPGEAIDGATQALSRNLVALIPDEAFSLFDTLDTDHLTRGDVWSELQTLRFQAAVDGDWVRLAPIRKAAAHEERLDRTLLSNLLKGAPDGPSHLEQIAPIAISGGGVARSKLLRDVLQLWSHNLNDQVTRLDWIAMRLFGYLTESQRQTLQSGGELIALETSPEAQLVVHELLDRGLYSNPKSTGRSISLLALQPLEQTNMLPTGLAPDVTIGGVFTATPLASLAPPAGRTASDDDKKVPLSDVTNTLVAGTPVEYGMAYSLDIKVRLYPSLYSSGNLSENFYMGLAKTVADLPPPYVHALARYKKD
jgi:hypothetical protein